MHSRVCFSLGLAHALLATGQQLVAESRSVDSLYSKVDHGQVQRLSESEISKGRVRGLRHPLIGKEARGTNDTSFASTKKGYDDTRKNRRE